MSHSVRAVFMSSHEILQYLSEVVFHPRSAARSHTNNKKCGSSHYLEVCVPVSECVPANKNASPRVSEVNLWQADSCGFTWLYINEITSFKGWWEDESSYLISLNDILWSEENQGRDWSNNPGSWTKVQDSQSFGPREAFPMRERSQLTEISRKVRGFRTKKTTWVSRPSTKPTPKALSHGHSSK